MCPGDNDMRQSNVYLIQPRVLPLYDPRTEFLISQAQSLVKSNEFKFYFFQKSIVYFSSRIPPSRDKC